MMGNPQPTYDSLEYATELKEAGVPEAQAKIQAKALFRVIEQQLVTKQDVKELEVKLEVKIKELEVKLSHDIQMMQLEMKGMENRLVIKLGGIVAGLLGLTIAIIGVLISLFLKA